MAVTACSGDDAGSVRVEDPWARPAPAAAANAAFYMTLESESTDRLVGVDAEVCRVTELHEVSMVEGVMSMRQVEAGFIELPADATVTLEPGGLHVMCIDKTGQLDPGDTIPITLRFADAPPVTLEVPVEDR